MSSIVREADVEDALCAEFGALGWTVFHASDAPPGPVGPIARDSRRDVLLRPILRAALVRLNPAVPPEGIDQALAVLCRDRSAMVPVNANQEFYGILRDGVKVSTRDAHGAEHHHTVLPIDWNTPAHNEFLLVRQLPVTSVTSTLVPDLVGFVNGIALLVAELKGVTVPVREAIEKNLATYRREIPQLLVPNAVVLISNGLDTRVGSMTGTLAEHFARWTRLAEDAPRATDMHTTARALFAPARFLDLVENFTLYEQGDAGLRKLLGQNHQLLGVNAAVERVTRYGELLSKGADAKALAEARRLGVFWHTQGSGKSYAMAFLVRKVLRKVPGDWAFVVVTDREDLDDQIHKNFVAVGAARGRHLRAGSAEALKKLLTSNEKVVFTLIQKFRLREGEKAHPVVSKAPQMLVLADEAHRSQYAEFATNLRRALPNAGFMAFTGTPLIAGDETTVERFGDYVSRYPFFQAIEDGATVPLYYEATVPGVQLTRADLDEALARAVENAGLTAEEQERAEQELSTFYLLLNRSSRLDAVARNLVEHFLGFAPPMKAMVVCIDRPTTLRLFQRVEATLGLRRRELAARAEQLPYEDEAMRRIIAQRLDELDQLQLAVVLSRSQGDVDLLARQLRYRPDGIIAYARRMEAAQQVMTAGLAEAYRGDEAAVAKGPDEAVQADRRWVEGVLPRDADALAKRFKKADDPLRLVFVCSMWITGFDAPACGVVYLDRPMANHALMQTIARANRVFPGKDFGLVVDYVGVLQNLERAFGAYEEELRGAKIDRPVEDKAKVLAALAEAVKEAVAGCAEVGVDLADLQGTDRAERLVALEAAVDAFAAAPRARGSFRRMAGQVDRLYGAVGEDARRDAYTDAWRALGTLARALRATVDDPEALSRIMDRLDRVLDEALDADETHPVATVDRFDLTDLDLVALERLRTAPQAATRAAALGAYLQRVAQVEAAANPTLVGLQRRVEEALEEYAQGAKDLAALIESLRREAGTLKAHQARAAVEGLTRTQLMDFDVALEALGEAGQTGPVREGVKGALRALATTLPAAMGLDWRGTDQGRARVEIAVRDALTGSLATVLSGEQVHALRTLVFGRVYERGG